MTAFAPFPPIPSIPAQDAADPFPGPPAEPSAETRLAAAVLRLGPDRAASRLHAAFGAGQGSAVAAACARLSAAMGDAPADADTLARLVAATLVGPDGDERARPMALCLGPAHRMPALVLAARDFGLALRRAVLRGHGAVPHPCAAAAPNTSHDHRQATPCPDPGAPANSG